MPLEWIYGLVGGLIIGLAGALFLLGNGRIMGASGILGELVDGSAKETATEKVTFIAGLIVVPGIVALVMGGSETNLTPNLAVVIAGGLLVGIGTRLANGCTSGHGVCGISRLSPRGIIATLFYLLAGGITVLAFKHLWGFI